MRIPKLKKGDCLAVKWLDAFTLPDTWQDEGDIVLNGEYSVLSVGFFYGLSKKYLVICGDVAPAATARVFYIPLGMIEKIQKVGR